MELSAKERKAASDRASYYKHYGERRRKQKEYYAENKEKIKASVRNWNSANSEYSSYSSMLKRCYNESNLNYSYYGGRGIRVCNAWLGGYSNFLKDMGIRPKGTSLDRIDPDKNYEPSNCKWSTRTEQMRNTRRKNNKYARHLA